MKKYVLALDAGTTSSRAIIFDKNGNALCTAQKEFRQIYPKPGWVEHDPMEIWSSEMGVAVEAMQLGGVKAEEISAIGITNQRETTIVWDAESGRPVYNAIVWQCRRTAEAIEKMKSVYPPEKVCEKTGLIPDAYFSASKIAWILDNVPGAREKAERNELRFGTVDSWLIWNLTGGRVHATDYTNASRTMLFDIHELKWDSELCAYFNIPLSMLPAVLPSSGFFGETELFGGEIPIMGAAGDQQCALYGQGGFSEGDIKTTYGTGGFMLMNTGAKAVKSGHGLLTTIAASNAASEGNRKGASYALEGSIYIAGAAVQWLRDELKLIESAAETEKFCLEVEDSGGMYFVPAFSGLGAPYWNPYARGLALGITRGSTKAQFIRAVVESMAYQVSDVLEAMEADCGIRMNQLKVDGGASANDLLLQTQADLCRVPIIRPQCVETTAMGAAYLAGLAAGFWKDREEISKIGRTDRIFSPAISEEERERKLKGWHKAVSCAAGWAREEDS